MDFSLTDDQELMIESAREYAERYFTDEAVKQAYEVDHHISVEAAMAYREAGFMHMGLPEDCLLYTSIHAKARHGPHEALARGALALNESLQSVRIDNVLVVLAWNIRRNRFRTNSEDDLICTKVLDVCRGDLGVQTNIDVEALDLVVVPIDHRRQFVVENLTNANQAACLLLLIDSGDVGVTAHTHGTSSLETSRASTDDEDLLLCLVTRDRCV